MTEGNHTNTVPTQANHPTAFVILGGTGDLAGRELLPALFHLYQQGALPERFAIIGVSRESCQDDVYQTWVREKLQAHTDADAATCEQFCASLSHVSGDVTESTSYEAIKQTLKRIDDSWGMCTNKLFYLAIPPQFYSSIFTHLKESGAMNMCDGEGSWSRLLVEKPFGRNLQTAHELEEVMCARFDEHQIYRIDHYLAKRAIENILSLRFANRIFHAAWQPEFIESISVRLLETKDVQDRGSFYDSLGALRDVGQNHVLQILALLTMPEADLRDVDAMRHARAQAIDRLPHTGAQSYVRGQYTGYKQTEEVAEDSTTETYFKIQTPFAVADTESDSNAWSEVLLELESGKALHEKHTDAVVTFKSAETCHCPRESKPHQHKNVLTITFAPEERITLTTWLRRPGMEWALEERELELTRGESTSVRTPEAYERVLYDCIQGDQTRFVSSEEVLAAWRFIEPILEQFADAPLHTYEPGSRGPEVALTETSSG